MSETPLSPEDRAPAARLVWTETLVRALVGLIIAGAVYLVLELWGK